MKTTHHGGGTNCAAIFQMILCEWFEWSGAREKWFAKELKRTVTTITFWCQGKRSPRLKHLGEISRITGIQPCCFTCEACARAAIATHHGWLKPPRGF